MWYNLNLDYWCIFTKGLAAELTSPHAQSAWGSKGERVQTAGLAACCNYLSKKKKLSSFYIFILCFMMMKII